MPCPLRFFSFKPIKCGVKYFRRSEFFQFFCQPLRKRDVKIDMNAHDQDEMLARKIASALKSHEEALSPAVLAKLAQARKTALDRRQAVLQQNSSGSAAVASLSLSNVRSTALAFLSVLFLYLALSVTDNVFSYSDQTAASSQNAIESLFSEDAADSDPSSDPVGQ